VGARTVTALVDGFGRHITYLRLSVTDRCDLRCRYCMSETITFMPRRELLTIKELGLVADAFIARGKGRRRSGRDCLCCVIDRRTYPPAC